MYSMIGLTGPEYEHNAIQAGNIIFARAFNRPHKVDLDAPPALAYWCREFKTTPERLLDVVKKAGTNPSIVRKLLLEK